MLSVLPPKLFRIKLLFTIILLVWLLTGQSICLYAQNSRDIKLGAYYFDGWTGKTFHITPLLRDSFPERKPIMGWLTSTKAGMRKQIKLASQAGLYFFDFCWYYNGQNIDSLDADPKNNALNLYLKATNNKQLKFALMIANHDGYTIKAAHWERLTDYWCKLLGHKNYLAANGKPLFTIFSPKSLIKTFGDTTKTRLALELLRQKAQSYHLAGVSIAAVVNPNNDTEVKLALACGFDILTGYNHHSAGFDHNKVVAIDSLIKKEPNVWDKIRRYNKPYIPVTTLNWDQRPWYQVKPQVRNEPRYQGFSENSVYRSVQSLLVWVTRNSQHVPAEKIAMIYAWNEYGEGAWLTPAMCNQPNPLKGLKKALKK